MTFSKLETLKMNKFKILKFKHSKIGNKIQFQVHKIDNYDDTFSLVYYAYNIQNGENLRETHFSRLKSVSDLNDMINNVTSQY